MSPLAREERYWALFYMPLYPSLDNSLNVLVQIANKMGLVKKEINSSNVMWLPLPPQIIIVAGW
jgi:hypothetical protein